MTVMHGRLEWCFEITESFKCAMLDYAVTALARQSSLSQLLQPCSAFCECFYCFGPSVSTS